MVAEPDLLVLYDGVCALCNGLVKFVVKRDRRDRFRFTALQGERAREIVRRHGGDPDQLDTMYLVLRPGAPDEEILTRGRAALRTLREVGGPWRLLGVFALLPDLVLDFFYGLVARRRYKTFGRYDQCPVPPPEQRHKFL
jgi:predicted DCC family thiol-disulfide oxidoreductase YuxK